MPVGRHGRGPQGLTELRTCGVIPDEVGGLGGGVDEPQQRGQAGRLILVIEQLVEELREQVPRRRTHAAVRPCGFTSLHFTVWLCGRVECARVGGGEGARRARRVPCLM